MSCHPNYIYGDRKSPTTLLDATLILKSQSVIILALLIFVNPKSFYSLVADDNTHPLLYSVQLIITLFANKKLLFGPRYFKCLPQGNRKLKKSALRQSDVMSDLEKMIVMLGNYSGNHSDEELNENIEGDSRSNGTRTDMVRNCEDFRTLLNSDDRIRSEIPVETTKFTADEIAHQLSRKLDELKRKLNTQITESINSAIHDSKLPSIQKSLSGQNSGLETNVDSRSSRLSRNTEGRKHQSAWGNTQNRVQSISTVTTILILGRTH